MIKKILIKIRRWIFRIIYLSFYPFISFFDNDKRVPIFEEKEFLLKGDLNKERSYDLSIIVPVYNVREYLNECINSLLLNKSIRYRVEYIFVNDGSSDDSLNILQKYADEENFIIISQENSGLSSARNKGMSISRGKKIMFIDSDDVLIENIDDILDECNDSKITVFNYKRFKKSLVNYNKLVKNEVIFKDNYFVIEGYAWGKVYDYKLFENNYFPINYWYEDTLIHFLVFPKASAIKKSNKVIYGYRKNKNSITSRKNKKNPKNLDTVYISRYLILEYLKRYGKDDYLLNLSLKQFSNITLSRIKKLNNKQILIAFSIMEETMKLFYDDEIKIESFWKKALLKSFKKRNIIKWKILCFSN